MTRWRIAVLLTFVAGVTPLLRPQASTPTFRAAPTVVMAPALVTTKSGEIVHGLTAADFIIEEAGVEQRIRLDETPESAPISLVVAVQRGGSAYLHFEPVQEKEDEPSLSGLGSRPYPSRKRRDAALSGLGEMVEDFIGDAKSEVAVVTFDREARLLQNFTEDVPAVAEKLNTLQGNGAGGAAIRDAVAYSLHLLEQRPSDRRRVLLLIGEQRDQGSHTPLGELSQQIARSNTLVYSVAFSPSRAELLRDLKSQNSQPMDLLAPVFMGVSAMKKNTARAVAEFTGGEYLVFTNKHTFDGELATLANHFGNRYLLSFQPVNPQPGPHRFTVRLRDPQKNLTVHARSVYWVAPAMPDHS